MEWEVSISTNDIQSYSNIEQLVEDGEHPFPNYALCLPNYSKLDGSFSNLVSIDNGNVGYMSAELSDENGDFTTYPTITIEFQRKKTSKGLNLLFNTLSGDYCSELSISWYKKNGELAYTKDYTPDSVSFDCGADVTSFTRAVIIFKKTSKPYRYLWISFLENNKISQTEGLKIIYYDTAYQLKEKVVESIEGSNREIGEYETLLLESAKDYPDYALCLPNYSKLDGTYVNMPSSPQEMGFISTQCSNSEGVFEEYPTLAITLNEYVSSRGISLYQNNQSNDYCDGVNIYWYRDDSLLDSKSFTPDSVDYLCVNQVDNYNKVVIEFTHTLIPYRFAFLRGFDFGIIRIFTEKEITDCSVYHEIDPISTELTINTMDFALWNKSELNLDFKKSQKCKVFFDSNIIGMFYVKKGTRESQYEYSISTEDYISILDGSYHYGGIYENKNVVELLKEMFSDESIEINIDDSFNDVTISGYLPYDTKRNNLAQICIAIGGIVNTAFDDTLFIFPYVNNDPRELNESEIYSSTLKVNHDDIVTGIELSVHSYSKGTEEKELFTDTLTGQTLVEFSDPCYDLTISGGTIDSYSDNHAFITGTGDKVTLTGKKYVHETQILSIDNTYDTNNKKIVSVEDATLVNSSNAPIIISRLLDYYNNNQSLNMDMLLDDLEISDSVKLDTYEGSKTGIIVSADMQFTNEIKAGVKIQCRDT